MIDYPSLLRHFTELLRTEKLKFTRQREAILRALYETDDHLSPEALHRIVTRDNPDLNVGIATVYRTLTLLEGAGLAESISFGKNGKKYEIGFKKHHDHLVCTGCGKIIEFTDDIIEERQRIIAKQFRFAMQEHVMKIVGLCETCQQNHDETHA
jgi:Fur family ferric uptake transcriptional regulator